MAVTEVGRVSIPAHDGSTNAATHTFDRTSSPLSDAQAGDLIIVTHFTKTTSTTPSVSADGGQTWADVIGAPHTTSTNRLAQTWACIFDGTWDADPAFDMSTVSQAHTAVMLILRPPSGYTWEYEGEATGSNGSAPTTPFDVTVTGRTFGDEPFEVVGFSYVMSADDNEWQAQTAGWSSNDSSHDNIAGTDMGVGIAWNEYDASATATGDVTWRQTANGGDVWMGRVLAWRLVADDVTGSGSPALAALSASGSGDVAVEGSGSGTTAPLLASGSGDVSVEGSGSGTLAPLAASGSGTVEDPSITGSGTAALAPLTADGDGAVEVAGSGAATSGALAASGSGDVAVEGSGGAQTAALAASGAGDVSVEGAGSAALGPLQAAGTASAAVEGSGSVTSTPTVAGSGAVEVTGSGSATSGALSVQGTASQAEVRVGNGTATLGALSAQGAGAVDVAGSGSAASGALSAQGAGAVEVSGAGAAALPFAEQASPFAAWPLDGSTEDVIGDHDGTPWGEGVKVPEHGDFDALTALSVRFKWTPRSGPDGLGYTMVAGNPGTDGGSLDAWAIWTFTIPSDPYVNISVYGGGGYAEGVMTGLVTLDEEYDALVTIGGGVARFYLDGVLVSEAAFSLNADPVGADVHLLHGVANDGTTLSTVYPPRDGITDLSIFAEVIVPSGANGSGAVGITGAGAAALAPATASGTADAPISGAGVLDLAALEADGAGGVAITGSGSAQLAAVGASGVALLDADTFDSLRAYPPDLRWVFDTDETWGIGPAETRWEAST
jgi:hypothetical protein